MKSILEDTFFHLCQGVEPSRSLNASQQKASASATAQTLTLIQGPPGTGKTTTCVQILRSWALTFKPPNKSTRALAVSYK